MAPIINGRDFYNRMFKSPFMQKVLPKNPTASQLANLALISTLTKDGLNCYYYTTQSLNNKKIPEDKRKFVAALDLSNGLMNIAVPLATAPLVKKYSDPLFEKLFGRFFNEKAGKDMIKTLSDAKVAGAKGADKVIMNGAKKWGKAGFAVIVMLVFSQILCKRIITPTISTPMADIFKKQLEKAEEKANAAKAAKDARAAEESEQDEAAADVKDSKETEEAKAVKDTQQTAQIKESAPEIKNEVREDAEKEDENLFNSLASKQVKFIK